MTTMSAKNTVLFTLKWLVIPAAVGAAVYQVISPRIGAIPGAAAIAGLASPAPEEATPEYPQPDVNIKVMPIESTPAASADSERRSTRRRDRDRNRDDDSREERSERRRRDRAESTAPSPAPQPSGEPAAIPPDDTPPPPPRSKTDDPPADTPPSDPPPSDPPADTPLG